MEIHTAESQTQTKVQNEAVVILDSFNRTNQSFHPANQPGMQFATIFPDLVNFIQGTIVLS
jgi:hypothetical protein